MPDYTARRLSLPGCSGKNFNPHGCSGGQGSRDGINEFRMISCFQMDSSEAGRILSAPLREHNKGIPNITMAEWKCPS
jgi:hypothetical protein